MKPWPKYPLFIENQNLSLGSGSSVNTDVPSPWLPFPRRNGTHWPLLVLTPSGLRAFVATDRCSEEVFERDGSQMLSPGLYVDLEPWRCHFLKLTQM